VLVPTIELIRDLAKAADLNDPSGSASGPLKGAKIALYTALAAQPSVNSVWTDLTEATYTGYARQSATWTGPFDTAGGSALVSGSTAWTPTDSASPQSILGYALVTTDTPPHLLALENFPAPIPFQGPMDGFTLLVQAGMINVNNLGTAAVVS
jgi:hypothetical protein